MKNGLERRWPFLSFPKLYFPIIKAPSLLLILKKVLLSSVKFEASWEHDIIPN